jgi:hypothetical protein
VSDGGLYLGGSSGDCNMDMLTFSICLLVLPHFYRCLRSLVILYFPLRSHSSLYQLCGKTRCEVTPDLMFLMSPNPKAMFDTSNQTAASPWASKGPLPGNTKLVSPERG